MGLVPFAEMRSSVVLVQLPAAGRVVADLRARTWSCRSPSPRSPRRSAPSATSARCRRSTTPTGSVPTCEMIRRGLTANGIAMIARRPAGQRARIGTSSGSVGLRSATGVTSASSALPPARCSSSWRSCPAIHELIILVPRPVMGGALVFTSCFIIVGGMQVMMSRLMDGRRTLVIGVRAAARLQPLPVPGLLCRRRRSAAAGRAPRRW